MLLCIYYILRMCWYITIRRNVQRECMRPNIRIEKNNNKTEIHPEQCAGHGREKEIAL